MSMPQDWRRSQKRLKGPRLFKSKRRLNPTLSELADLQVALDRLHDATDPVVSLQDMSKDLGL
jgi:hypothetical protein